MGQKAPSLGIIYVRYFCTNGKMCLAPWHKSSWSKDERSRKDHHDSMIVRTRRCSRRLRVAGCYSVPRILWFASTFSSAINIIYIYGYWISPRHWRQTSFHICLKHLKYSIYTNLTWSIRTLNNSLGRRVLSSSIQCLRPERLGSYLSGVELHQRKEKRKRVDGRKKCACIGKLRPWKT